MKIVKRCSNPVQGNRTASGGLLAGRIIRNVEANNLLTVVTLRCAQYSLKMKRDIAKQVDKQLMKNMSPRAKQLHRAARKEEREKKRREWYERNGNRTADA